MQRKPIIWIKIKFQISVSSDICKPFSMCEICSMFIYTYYIYYKKSDINIFFWIVDLQKFIIWNILGYAIK